MTKLTPEMFAEHLLTGRLGVTYVAQILAADDPAAVPVELGPSRGPGVYQVTLAQSTDGELYTVESGHFTGSTAPRSSTVSTITRQRKVFFEIVRRLQAVYGPPCLWQWHMYWQREIK